MTSCDALTKFAKGKEASGIPAVVPTAKATSARSMATMATIPLAVTTEQIMTNTPSTS